MRHSPKVANKLLDIYRKAAHLSESAKGAKFAESIYSMGPGCLFDEFEEGSEQEAGALKVLEWIEKEFG